MFCKLIFDGEYLYNHRRRGKEFVEGKLVYEGEYLFDIKFNGIGYDGEGNKIYELNNGNGKIKEYDDFGILRFEGEYLNFKKNGKGKEYYDTGEIKYEGEYLNGERNGKGKEYNYNGKLLYEGEYLKGKKNGKGKAYVNGNLFFEGEYIDGKKWDGKYYDQKGNKIYELKNGTGLIKEYYWNGKIKSVCLYRIGIPVFDIYPPNKKFFF